jgi:S-adenosylmethionine:diacylglycerol 3-amino-3-carboxypropyl transferase
MMVKRSILKKVISTYNEQFLLNAKNLKQQKPFKNKFLTVYLKLILKILLDKKRALIHLLKVFVMDFLEYIQVNLTQVVPVHKKPFEELDKLFLFKTILKIYDIFIMV